MTRLTLSRHRVEFQCIDECLHALESEVHHQLLVKTEYARILTSGRPNPARANMAQLREWLEARGLGRYADALLAQDIEIDILPQLTDADLTAAGLPVGARKRLLQAIDNVAG